MRATRLAVLGVLLLLPGANAAFLLGSHDYQDNVGYTSFAAGSDVSLFGGQVDVTATAETATSGFLNLTSRAEMTGIERICSFDFTSGCVDGALRIAVDVGDSFGFRVPGTVATHALSDRAVGAFVDFPADQTLNELGLSRSFIGLLEGSAVDVTLPSVPVTLLATDSNSIVLKAVLGGRVNVYEAGASTPFYTLSEDDAGLLIQGAALQLATMEPEMVLLAVNGGASSEWSPASGGGLPITQAVARLNDVLLAVGGNPMGEPSLGPLNDLVGAMFNGAYLSMGDTAQEGNPLANMTLVRFDHLEATASGTSIALDGSGALVVQEGSVAGAQPLVGASYFQVPWWTIMLWVIAIAAFIVRLTLKDKAPKEHPKWDRFNWIGRVASIAAGILVFILWDGEVKELIGTSMLSGARGSALIVVLVLQPGFLLGVTLLAQRPLKMILGNTTRILRQGRFMGLAGPVAILIGYLLTGPLILSYLQLAIQAAG